MNVMYCPRPAAQVMPLGNMQPLFNPWQGCGDAVAMPTPACLSGHSRHGSSLRLSAGQYKKQACGVCSAETLRLDPAIAILLGWLQAERAGNAGSSILTPSQAACSDQAESEQVRLLLHGAAQLTAHNIFELGPS